MALLRRVVVRGFFGFAAIFFPVTMSAPAAMGGWPFEVHSGVPLCSAPGDQTSPQIVSDGAGGAIVVWTDLRAGVADLYAQRVSRLGDPMWSANGIGVCSVAGAQTLPRVVADGAGGAIVAWQDARGANVDVYAQRISGNGALVWFATGLPVCVLGADQHDLTLTADGVGGAILAWVDGRAGFLLEDIYAQRIDAAGSPQWTANGIAVCTAGSFQIEPRIVSDDAGGAIVTWTDWRAESNIYAQRVGGSGSTLWTPNGVPVCMATNLQSGPVPIPDGSGGAIIAWVDYRTSGTTSTDIYMQRISAAGSPLWMLDGVAACAGTGAQLNIALASDGAGGADIVWEDQSYTPPDSRIHWDHVGPNGYSTLYSAGCGYEVSSGSRPVLVRTGATPFAGYQTNGITESDAWITRLVPGNFERVDTPACDAPGDQTGIALAADDNRGVIVAWQDQRPGQSDIYVHRLDNYGFPGITEPVITSARDVVHDQGGAIKVSWLPAHLEELTLTLVSDYRVWRAVPPDYAVAKARSGTSIIDAELDETSPLTPGPTIVREPSADEVVYWEFVGAVPVSGNSGYSFLVPTLGDSVAGWNPLTRVRVQLWGSTAVNLGYLFLNSLPDSGYSVDNLGPAQPAGLAGQHDNGETALTWNANVEPDLANYRLYRGSSPSFTPSAANRIAEPTQPHHTDPAASPYVYKLTAVDVHGNESPHATLVLSGVIAAPPASAAGLFFAPPAPNPSGTSDAPRFRFRLPTATTVRLAIHDLSGRRVRVLAADPMSAGEHTVAWDRCDDAGGRVAAGVYIARLEVNQRATVRRVVLID